MSEWKIRFGTAGTSDSFTAMGLFQSVVSAILLLSTNAIAKWINGEGIW